MTTNDLDEDFPLARYLPHALDPQRTPEETVLGYIEAFQTWARDCYHWGLAHQEEALMALPAPLAALRQNQSHWCSSRVSTAGRKRPQAPALRFHLERHAGVWRIAWLEAQYGRGPWALAPL